MSKNEVFELFLQNSAISVTRLKNGNLCYKDGTGHTLSTSNVLRKYYEVANFLPEKVSIDASDVENYLSEHAPVQKGKDKEERIPPLQYVSSWITGNAEKWKISTNGKRITCWEYGVPRDKDMEDIITAVQATVDEQQLPYREGEITRAVKYYFMMLDQQGAANIYNRIKYDPTKVKACMKWLRNVYDFFKPEESFELFCILMMHWGWQVKRKLLGRKVLYHIWLNFFGAAGTGKTTFIQKMTSPMEDVTSTTTISKIFDDTREIKRLTENLVLIFDELALNVDSEESGKLNADQKAILKSIITGEFLDARVYGTQNQAKKKITFSCISSANNHLYDIIYDETTMRRFFEFHCTAEKVKDFKEINKTLDHSEYFWYGIDEDLEHGYFNPDCSMWEEISKIQRSYYPTKSSVYEWMKDTKAKPGNRTPVAAYRAYRQFCINAGCKPKTMMNFVADIKHAMPDSIRGETVMLDFNMTEMCMKDGGASDDIPSNYGDMKPVEPPTMDKPIVSEFV